MDRVDAYLQRVFPTRRLFSPDRAQFLDLGAAIVAVETALTALGIADTQARLDSPGDGAPRLPDPPRYVMERVPGDASYALNFYLSFRRAESAMLSLSWVAPVFTLVDHIRVYHSSWDTALAVEGPMRIDPTQPPYADVLAGVEPALASCGIRYVAWTSPELDVPFHLVDSSGAKRRDCLFNCDSQ